MPHYRRFLGVNSVTNIEPDKGVMPVPIIRNAYWFEKFSFPGVPQAPLTETAAGTCWQRSLRNAPKIRELPSYEHSGYAV
ncbi:hypothetical protein G3435_07665 [Pseudomonas sp. MAFF212428]|uniref:Uncharacterized protein n=1 Tax=Pseudomonas brassicae TaxID=2708063 RepID=A0A6B3NWX8_9PSED|nr:hypothetical protein [Pseudomonas brassicae]NER59885.1 hypothetical protein [Pseudomonas brassicae]NER66579.1 hypothetical protein [Pseudomonas brassicae]